MSHPAKTSESLWTIPNVLTLLRLPAAVVIFVCIALHWWLAALVVFVIGALTDWADGYLARKLNQQSDIGRNLDPLIDKVLTGGVFIFLIPVKDAEIEPWMATVVIGREMLITGLRGMMETKGFKFGADWFGKIKTILQMTAIIAVLVVLWLRNQSFAAGLIGPLHIAQIALIYAMLAATIGSGLQYVVKAARLFR